MRKFVVALGLIIFVAIMTENTLAAPAAALGPDPMPTRMSIAWTFAVYAYPDFETRSLASFGPQYVDIIQHDEGDGWILINTYLGNVWTNIIRPLDGRIIILDAGHGLGSDNIFEGYSEQATMLKLAHLLRPLLEEQGATVFLTRETEANVTLPERAAKINLLSLETLRQNRLNDLYIAQEYNRQAIENEIEEIDELIGIMQRIINDYYKYAPTYFNFPFDWSFQRHIHPDLQRIFEFQADSEIQSTFLMISLHSNATRRPINSNINGVDIYRMTNDLINSANYFADYASTEKTYLFSNILLDSIQEVGISPRGINAGNWFVIREHNLPGVLVENGFHTNPHDRALLSCDYFIYRLAEAYADAIMRYFEYID